MKELRVTHSCATVSKVCPAQGNCRKLRMAPEKWRSIRMNTASGSESVSAPATWRFHGVASQYHEQFEARAAPMACSSAR